MADMPMGAVLEKFPTYLDVFSMYRLRNAPQLVGRGNIDRVVGQANGSFEFRAHQTFPDNVTASQAPPENNVS